MVWSGTQIVGYSNSQQPFTAEMMKTVIEVPDDDLEGPICLEGQTLEGGPVLREKASVLCTSN